VVRLDEVGVVGEVALEPLLVGRQPEEPVLLGQPLERDVGVVRADRPARRVQDVGRVEEPLVRAIPALVRPGIDVTRGIRAANHLLGRHDVIRVRRPDEAIRADPESVLGRLEIGDLLVDELPRCAPGVDRCLGDVDRMLVRAREEPGVVALHPVPAGDDIRPDHLIQRVDPGLVVGVGNRGRQVVARAGGVRGHRVLVGGKAWIVGRRGDAR